MPKSSLVTDERHGSAPTGVEAVFAELLAEILCIDRVSVDSHFFDDLGADSLVMAKFCARVRKRGDFPPVSMQDIYRHPTIRSLAAALPDAAPAPSKSAAAKALEVPTSTSTREYLLCGALQTLFYLGYSYVGVLAGVEGYQRMVAGSKGVESYLRLVVFSGVGFLVVCAVPIVAKWLLIEPGVRPLLDRENLDPLEPGRLFVRRYASVPPLSEGARRESGARYRDPLRADTGVYGPAHDRRRNSDPQRVELPLLQGTGRSNRDRNGDPRP